MSGMSIGEVARRSGLAASTLRYYEDTALLRPPVRSAGRRRYDESVLLRLEVIALCKAAGFSLDEIRLLLADDDPGRPRSAELARSKLKAIDAQLDTLHRARAIVEWGLRCTCPSIDACSCGIHPAPPASSQPGDDLAGR